MTAFSSLDFECSDLLLVSRKKETIGVGYFTMGQPSDWTFPVSRSVHFHSLATVRIAQRESDSVCVNGSGSKNGIASWQADSLHDNSWRRKLSEQCRRAKRPSMGLTFNKSPPDDNDTTLGGLSSKTSKSSKSSCCWCGLASARGLNWSIFWISPPYIWNRAS